MAPATCTTASADQTIALHAHLEPSNRTACTLRPPCRAWVLDSRSHPELRMLTRHRVPRSDSHGLGFSITQLLMPTRHRVPFLTHTAWASAFLCATEPASAQCATEHAPAPYVNCKPPPIVTCTQQSDITSHTDDLTLPAYLPQQFPKLQAKPITSSGFCEINQHDRQSLG